MHTLAKLFPELAFAAEADRFLALAHEIPLTQQLRERHVSTLEIIPLLSNGGLSIGSDYQFMVLLNDTLTVEEAMQTFGHELGHTFHFDLSALPPRLRILPPEEHSDEFYELIERFCDAFSEQWLARTNSSGRVTAFVRERVRGKTL